MLTRFQAICSIPHLMLKFPTEDRIGEVRGDQVAAQTLTLEEEHEPYAKGDNRDEESRKRKGDENPSGGRKKASLNIELEWFGTDLTKPITETASETKEMALDPEQPTRKVTIDKDIPRVVHDELISLLREFKDIFAWGPEEVQVDIYV